MQDIVNEYIEDITKEQIISDISEEIENLVNADYGDEINEIIWNINVEEELKNVDVLQNFKKIMNELFEMVSQQYTITEDNIDDILEILYDYIITMSAISILNDAIGYEFFIEDAFAGMFVENLSENVEVKENEG